MILFLLSLVSAGVAFGQTTYPSWDPTGVTGCIGRWNFTSVTGVLVNSLNDKSGNNNNATPYNLIGANGFRGLANRAVTFNGASSYADVPSSATLSPTTAVTMVALVNFNDFYHGSCQFSQILAKGYGLSGSPYYDNGVYGLSVSDDVFDNGNCSNYDAAHQQLIAQVGNNIYTPTLGNYVTVNNWYLIAATFNGSTVSYYQIPMNPASYVSAVTPIYTSTLTNPNALSANGLPLTIGKDGSASFSNWFNGTIDEVALFNKALTVSEMQSVYDFLWSMVLVKPVPTAMCPGSTVPVTYIANDTLPSTFPANIFSVQLSDATGSFTSPITIGTVTSTVSGTISCTIPAGTPSGVGYRIRIASSNPAFISKDNGSDITIDNSMPATPVVTITATPSTHVNAGQIVTFNSSVTPVAPNLTYQWKKNGVNIPGATSSSYSTTNFLNTDIITLDVTNNTNCNTALGTSNGLVMVVTTSVGNVNGSNSDIVLYPNPNTGSFVVNGTISGVADNSVSIEVINALGQVIYNDNAQLHNGQLNKQVSLSQVPAGMYMLRIKAEGQTKVTRFSIDK